MSKAILGTKLGMSQVFAENGDLIPVTVVETAPNVVVAVKTVESDGYNAIQLGYGEVKEKHLTKPVKGQFEKAGVAPVKYLREVRMDETPSYTVGQTLAADIFAEGNCRRHRHEQRQRLCRHDQEVQFPSWTGKPRFQEPSSARFPRRAYVRRRWQSI